MFIRKLYVSVILAFIIAFFFSVSSRGELGGFLGSWFIIAPIVFACLLFYALPVSLISELGTRKINNRLVKNLCSLTIHVVFGLVLYFIDISLAIAAAIIAFFFYVLDELSRVLIRKKQLQRILSIVGVLFFICAVIMWLILLIQQYF